MVPADSRRIPRAPRYSGYRYVSNAFDYGTVTLYGQTFQRCSSPHSSTMFRSYNPGSALRRLRFGLFPVRSPLLGESLVYFLFLEVLRCFSSLGWLRHRVPVSGLQPPRLSHSEILGLKVICTFPRLIAAYHVLHRLCEPRHPPYALSYFLTDPALLQGCSYFQLSSEIAGS